MLCYKLQAKEVAIIMLAYSTKKRSYKADSSFLFSHFLNLNAIMIGDVAGLEVVLNAHLSPLEQSMNPNMPRGLHSLPPQESIPPTQVMSSWERAPKSDQLKCF